MDLFRRSSLAFVLVIALVGCPGAGGSPPAAVAERPTPRGDSPRASAPARHEPPRASAPARTLAQGEPRREQGAGEALTRQDLLALDPADLCSGGLRGAAPGGLAPDLAGVGVLALGEQLEAGAVPPEALDLCLVQLLRARDDLHGPLDVAARAALARNLAVQTAGLPALDRWMSALLEAAREPADLEAAVAFVDRARQTWAMTARLRALGAPR